MIIDSHQHFWEYNPDTHSWIDSSMQEIRRDFMPGDLKPVYEVIGIDGCVSVQADQSEKETHFLLDLAEEFDFIRAVVGWVDLRDENLEERLEYFSRFQKLAGFRHILQSEKPEKMLEPAFLRGIEMLQKKGYTYDILIYPEHLDAAIQLVRRYPGQKFVVDHLAKPPVKDGVLKPWAAKIRELAKAENVFCKVSGMVTEADWNRWKPEDFEPYLDVVFESFGTNRLLYGSDWPVCLLAGSYREVYSVITGYLDNLSTAEKKNVMGKNAIDFYEINGIS